MNRRDILKSPLAAVALRGNLEASGDQVIRNLARIKAIPPETYWCRLHATCDSAVELSFRLECDDLADVAFDSVDPSGHEADDKWGLRDENNKAVSGRNSGLPIAAEGLLPPQTRSFTIIAERGKPAKIQYDTYMPARIVGREP